MISTHATKIEVSTVLGTQRDKLIADKINDEMVELKNLASQNKSDLKIMSNEMKDFGKKFPRFESEMGNMKVDVSSKCSREEINAIRNAVPGMVTKHELEEVREQSKEFISKRDLLEYKQDIIKMQETLKKQPIKTELDSFKKQIDTVIEKLNNDKVEKYIFKDEIDMLKKAVEIPRQEISKLEEKVDHEIQKLKKVTDKLFQNIELKVSIDAIMEINDKINKMA